MPLPGQVTRIRLEFQLDFDIRIEIAAVDLPIGDIGEVADFAVNAPCDDSYSDDIG